MRLKLVYVIGVDIGGTFTDAFASDENGTVRSAKVLSTPPDYSKGFIESLESLANEFSLGVEELLANTAHICHGTTTTLNALVEGKTDKVGFITTKGHRDSIYIMNVEGRYLGLDPDEIQNVHETRKPQPLLPKRLAKEVTERVDCAGEVVVPLDREEAAGVASEFLREGVSAIAVSLLWSFKNPAHEREIREVIRGLNGGLYVALSSEVSPRIREFARNSTTIMTAQVALILKRYLDRLEERLKALGLRGPLLLMQSSGGVMAAKQAPKYAITTVGSVLSGGMTGAETLGRLLEHKNIITTDMGGTTFLAGLVVDGKPIFTSTTVIRQHELNVPTVYVRAIGSGGGAIAWADEDGKLRVGPKSAAASPGPACYGLGGAEPTVTDADLMLGILNEDFFLGGRMRIRKELAVRAFEPLISRLGMSGDDTAWGVFQVQNAQAADLVRKTVVEAGYDPRDFVMYAFGGAAPIHCFNFGSQLGVREVLVPLGPTASAFSAYGLAASDLEVTTELSDPCSYPVRADRVNAIFDRLEEELKGRLTEQGITLRSVSTQREVDIRYTLQIAEVPTPVGPGVLTEPDIEQIVSSFESIYEKLYGKGTGFREAGFQFITYRVRGRGHLPSKPDLPKIRRASGTSPREALKGRRPVRLTESGFRDTDIYDYTRLLHGHNIEGAAIVEAPTTTVVIPEGAVGEVDELGNIVMRFG